jgi:hypothetical protein
MVARLFMWILYESSSEYLKGSNVSYTRRKCWGKAADAAYSLRTPQSREMTPIRDVSGQIYLKC